MLAKMGRVVRKVFEERGVRMRRVVCRDRGFERERC